MAQSSYNTKKPSFHGTYDSSLLFHNKSIFIVHILSFINLHYALLYFPSDGIGRPLANQIANLVTTYSAQARRGWCPAKDLHKMLKFDSIGFKLVISIHHSFKRQTKAHSSCLAWQVTVAILLDSFITARAAVQDEKNAARVCVAHTATRSILCPSCFLFVLLIMTLSAHWQFTVCDLELSLMKIWNINMQVDLSDILYLTQWKPESLIQSHLSAEMKLILCDYEPVFGRIWYYVSLFIFCSLNPLSSIHMSTWKTLKCKYYDAASTYPRFAAQEQAHADRSTIQSTLDPLLERLTRSGLSRVGGDSTFDFPRTHKSRTNSLSSCSC